MYASSRASHRRRLAEKRRYPLSSNRSPQQRRSVFACDTQRLDKDTFMRILPTAIANGWTVVSASLPPPERQYISLTVFVDVADVTPVDLNTGIFFGFANVPVPDGFSIVRLLSVSVDVFPSVSGAIASKQVLFLIRYVESVVAQYAAATFNTPLNAPALSFVATAVGDALSVNAFHYLYDDTSDTQPVRSGTTSMEPPFPWAAWSLGVQLSNAAGNVGIRVGYTAEFRNIVP